MCESGYKMLRHLSHFECTTIAPRIPDMGQKGGGLVEGGDIGGTLGGGDIGGTWLILELCSRLF